MSDEHVDLLAQRFLFHRPEALDEADVDLTDLEDEVVDVDLADLDDQGDEPISVN